MSSKNSKLKILTNGFLNENPVLRLVLGTCPHPGHLYHGVQRHWYEPGGHLCAAVLQRGHLRPEKGHSRSGAYPLLHHGHRYTSCLWCRCWSRHLCPLWTRPWVCTCP